MTIASEISRLQTAKSCIKAAIEDKGVEVGSDVTLDEYSECIENIQVGGNPRSIDLLVVGGGGNGGKNLGGGGGGGGVIYREGEPIVSDSINVVVGARSCNSCFGNLVAYAGGLGGSGSANGCPGGNGGGGMACRSNHKYCKGGCGCPLQGVSGRRGIECSGGGGGGVNINYNCPSCYGGDGFQTDISGELCYYAGGGGGIYDGYNAGGLGGLGGGGCGGAFSCYDSPAGNGGNATYYGGGGGGGRSGGQGCQGIVILRYLTNGDCGIHSATGGCKYTCGNYTIHCFTSSDTFCIIC